MTTFRPWPTSIQVCSVPSAKLQWTRQRRDRDRCEQWLALPEYQKQLLRDAVSKYGSKRKPPDGWPPRHVFSCVGDAVDIGPSRATAWLSKHGAEYRLCRIYRNEPWHYELRPEAIDDGCPSMYADPRHDPRMQQ